ncbi:hypothetical protein BV25DRAFT_1099574 [Artomyces pyxidatus]|uniref:Uncharacterized protein n=1 Tax=Artomyces pyxidatus TaxID=48021 RepID=A0ACB8TG63_9AGAM|nr:hypothetical protein BV25DRAFT_1099574 [Artomyces pyxidatus]
MHPGREYGRCETIILATWTMISSASQVVSFPPPFRYISRSVLSILAVYLSRYQKLSAGIQARAATYFDMEQPSASSEHRVGFRIYPHGSDCSKPVRYCRRVPGR